MLFGIADAPEHLTQRSRKRPATATSRGSPKKPKATKESVENELLQVADLSELEKGREKGHVIDYLKSRYHAGLLGTPASP